MDGKIFKRLVKIVKPGLVTVNGKVQERGSCAFLCFYTLEQMETHVNNRWCFRNIGSQAAVVRDYKPECLLNLVKNCPGSFIFLELSCISCLYIFEISCLSVASFGQRTK